MESSGLVGDLVVGRGTKVFDAAPVQGEWRRLEDPDDVFYDEADELWSEVLRRKGGPFAVLALMPPDPSLN